MTNFEKVTENKNCSFFVFCYLIKIEIKHNSKFMTILKEY